MRSMEFISSETPLGNNIYTNAIEETSIYKEYLQLYKKFNLSTKIEEKLRPNLTGYTLVGPDKINFRSDSIFLIDDKFLETYNDIEAIDSEESNYSVTFFNLGSQLSGHEGIVHGGLLATLLDELTCRLAFQNFHSKKGVTANLNINYKKPCFCNSNIMIKCELIKKIGRKCWVRGLIYNMAEQLELVTECECLVIEPKWVKNL